MSNKALRIRPRHNNHGAAIILALTLLVLISILTTTFFFICNSEENCAEKTVIINIPERLSLSISRHIETTLVNDLYFCNDNHLYGSMYQNVSNSDAWRRFIDLPSDEQNGCDDLLSSFEANNGTWEHLTRIHGAITKRTNCVNITATSKTYLDADHDGVKDSYLGQPDQVTDLRNRDYNVAVRVIDLSGLICINTACGPSYLKKNLISPTNTTAVYLSDTPKTNYANRNELYDKVIKARTTDAMGLLSNYHQACARKLSSPNSGYTPFFKDEEAYLRSNITKKVQKGRLFDATKQKDNSPLDITKRKYLTTWSSMTPALRNPINDIRMRLNPNNISQQYDSAKKLLLSAFNTPNEIAEKTISHFLANADSYIDGRKQDKAYCHTLSNNTKIYGIVQQPVISEAYIASKFDINGEQTSSISAIEIFNPYNLDLSRYLLACGGKEFNLPSSINTWTIIRSDSDTRNIPTHLIFNALNLNNQPVSLIRRVDNIDIPMDEISIPTGQLPKPPPNYTGSIIETTTSRDTNLNRMRFLVALEHTQTNDQTQTIHTLGAPNNLPEDAINCKNGFYISSKISTAKDLLDLGELANLHAIGPDEQTSLPHKLAMFANCDSRGCIDLLNQWPENQSLCDSGIYPDIPWPMLIGEVFDLLQPDYGPSLLNDQPLIYGRININTAPADVLKKLPWPEKITIPPIDLNHDGIPEIKGSTIPIDINKIAATIISFRQSPTSDHRGPLCGGSETQTSAMKGFLTPSELTSPLELYTQSICNRNSVGYPLIRHALYKSVSNVISVRSNTFAAYITIQQELSLKKTRQWHYLNIIDRSKCQSADSLPQSLFFRLD